MRAARGLLGMSGPDLAAKAGVGLATIRRAESDNGAAKMIPATAAAIRRALEEAGIEFISDNGGGAGVRLRRP